MQDGESDMAKTLLRQDPLLLGQILLSRAKVVLCPTPTKPVHKWMGGLTYEFDFSDTALLDSFQHSQPAIKAMLHGSYEPTLRKVMRRHLGPGGVFIDADANIGYVSAVGASLVGPTGQVHSFEPVPQYFRRLQRLAEMNPSYDIRCNPHALGDQNGSATITLAQGNIGSNTLVPDHFAPEKVASSFPVPVRRLSDYLAENAVTRISLMKIDVEGFEFRVLKGMADYFAATGDRPPIVCEVNADTAADVGHTLAEFADYMGGLGYAAHRLIGRQEPVDLTAIESYVNVLFLPRASGAKTPAK